jgi:hypothetical protein
MRAGEPCPWCGQGLAQEVTVLEVLDGGTERFRRRVLRCGLCRALLAVRLAEGAPAPPAEPPEKVAGYISRGGEELRGL